MQWNEALILGALQGITEFLPISSSGHLILVEKWLSLDVEALKAFDISLHLGTLLAILIYFWKDVKGMFLAFLKLLIGKFDKNDEFGRLIVLIVLGTIPAVLLGYFGEDYLDSRFRNAQSVAVLLMIVGLLFFVAEWIYKNFYSQKVELKKWWQSLIIGSAQALALIPGVSRSGATITAAIFQGVERSKAARFSFLLGIPAVLGAGLLTGIKMLNDGSAITQLNFLSLIFGFFSSFLFGFASIWFLMKFLKKNSLIIFGVYRIALGILLLEIFL